MKKLTLTTENVLKAYNIIAQAKYTKLDDADKVRLWKIARALKPVATKYDEDSKDAAEKLKPEGFDEKAMKWNETRDKISAGIKDDLPMSQAEFIDFLYHVINPYNENVNSALEELKGKEVELEFNALTEDAFAKLMSSNEWNMEQVAMAGDIVCE
jgi:hypothetical protein